MRIEVVVNLTAEQVIESIKHWNKADVVAFVEAIEAYFGDWDLTEELYNMIREEMLNYWQEYPEAKPEWEQNYLDRNIP